MRVDWGAEVVAQVETHWAYQLRPRLDGLTDDEYFWQPVRGCWTVSRRGASAAPASYGGGDFTWDFEFDTEEHPVTTIAWRLAHLAAGLAEMNGLHFGRSLTSIETFNYAGTAQHALSQLDELFSQWIDGVRDLGQAGLSNPQGPSSPPEFSDEPMVRLIQYTSAEVIHHGAEVCLLRDLYAHRNKA